MIKREDALKIAIFIILILIPGVFSVWCEPLPIPKIGLDIETAENPKDVALSFTRNALGTQQMPPNQVLIGLALFLTFFVMSPVISEINETAFKPYTNNEISQEEAIKKASVPIRNFMFKYTREKDLALFLKLGQVNKPLAKSDIPTSALIPAFIISELKTAFEIGFFLYIPFLMIDMIVSSTLMSMGMMMLPPIMISMPFKILLFVMVDGWNLIIKSLILGFK